jgi:hypothetical protein
MDAARRAALLAKYKTPERGTPRLTINVGNSIVPNRTELMIVQVDGRRSNGKSAYAAATGSIRLGSLFLTLPTRALTGQPIISSDG